MATAAEAYAALRDRIETGGLTIPRRYQNLDADSNGLVPLPDVPEPFYYCEFIVETVDLASFGGGRYRNTYRNQSCFYVWTFVPRGWGLQSALDYAEQAAVLLRSYRTPVISCFGAWVIPGGDGAVLQPPGLRSEVNAYFYAFVETDLFFDQIG